AETGDHPKQHAGTEPQMRRGYWPLFGGWVALRLRIAEQRLLVEEVEHDAKPTGGKQQCADKGVRTRKSQHGRQRREDADGPWPSRRLLAPDPFRGPFQDRDR